MLVVSRGIALNPPTARLCTGNFTVMQKSSVAPTVTPEVSVTYKSLDVAIENQLFVPRPLNHPLNGRKAPTVRICDGVITGPI